MLFFGGHISIRNGYLAAARTALSMGMKAFQYFPKNPRSLAVKHFDRRDAQDCADYCERNGLLSVAHSSYLTNLAVADSGLKSATALSLLNELDVAEACGSIGLVVHFGKFKGTDPLQGYKNILQLVNDILNRWNGQALLLIENQAGSGLRMGTEMEELVQIRNLSADPERIRFCLDTCHLFASGVWNGGNWEELLQRGGQTGFFSHVKTVHLNDSAFPAGSFRDRHANIGRGHIGDEAFRIFLRSPFLQGVPVILETPVTPSYTYENEMKHIRELLN
ncbi:deoxyribonuclease IV [Ferviditalea candida]|uniref:Deoxyribonuclease IV n=1 Tax=Ferviditalea candida TaxID=3108399 RepID=A0ABU5ZJL3_9BACL|nr:deoxyribonuclease IV [Paenibacillaceae bacterium T2]